MSEGRADVTLAGRGVLEWLSCQAGPGLPGRERFGGLGVVAAGIDAFQPDRGRVEFAVLGPAEPANSLELAQVIVEQIAALPDAHLLADESIELRINRP